MLESDLSSQKGLLRQSIVWSVSRFFVSYGLSWWICRISGGLECDPEPQNRQGRASGMSSSDRSLVNLIDEFVFSIDSKSIILGGICGRGHLSGRLPGGQLPG